MRIILSSTLIFVFIFTLLALAKPTFDNTPVTLSWSFLPNTLVGCMGTAGVCLDGKYYQICGCSGGYQDYDRAQIFDGVSWSQSPCQHPMGVFDHSVAVWNNKIVVSGGGSYPPPSWCNYTTLYDPTAQTWVQSTPMPQSYMEATAMASVGDKCYLFGGWNGLNSLHNTYAWSPGDAAMVPKTNMPDVRSAPAAATYNGKIYIFGGSINYTAVGNNIWEYNPSSDSWTVKSTTLIQATGGATAVTIGDKIYVMGGFNINDDGTNTVQVYDPINNTISLGPPLLYATSGHAAGGYTIPLSNSTYMGKIFISGGGWSIIPYNTAILGTVTGVTFNKVQPESLGVLKALYK